MPEAAQPARTGRPAMEKALRKTDMVKIPVAPSIKKRLQKLAAGFDMEPTVLARRYLMRGLEADEAVKA